MYASRDNMVTRFGEREVIALTDLGYTAAIDDQVLAGGLSTASYEINGDVAGRYRLPLPTLPSILKGLACDIARYRLSGTERVCSDEIRVRYRNAIRYLEGVAAGRVSLGTFDDTGTTVPSSAIGVKFFSGRRTWVRRSTGEGGY
ncbi:DUF1320 domain-containing protein [Serratia symbiotica]|uniref:gp436 family protein n=1 Tax=Serratia symbiotica TaxID=138074 RepID=UPI001D4FC8C2|nr:DUF1320 domain-containing protein [Serratia symbiotica]NIG88533.1 DUF1320 domain-containing protein [Serratia symbiotica]USS96218.1 DUF1320 domain-containing protein [Serratia symbiotica]